jgi:hypothetical protein
VIEAIDAAVSQTVPGLRCMKLYVLDGESYYDHEYNLRRLDPASYILDPRFELIGIAVKEPGTAAYWVEGPDCTGILCQPRPQ